MERKDEWEIEITISLISLFLSSYFDMLPTNTYMKSPTRKLYEFIKILVVLIEIKFMLWAKKSTVQTD